MHPVSPSRTHINNCINAALRMRTLNGGPTRVQVVKGIAPRQAQTTQKWAVQGQDGDWLPASGGRRCSTWEGHPPRGPGVSAALTERPYQPSQVELCPANSCGILRTSESDNINIWKQSVQT